MSPQEPVERFGTFLGVFTPSILTILGLIMYLRFGWVVGNVGLPLTILILLMSSSITFITALSASAVATNMRVGVGGEYFLISRSLGLELGGTIGIPLFLCRTLSITFYSFGLAEAIVSFGPNLGNLDPDLAIQLLTAGIIIIITAVSGRSAALALKLQIPIMAAVGLSILALTAGTLIGGVRSPELSVTYRTAPEGFWYIFAVFFPAVTGFTAGIGMSGDLKDPSQSIPRGTILAVVVGAVTYLVILILLSMSARITVDDLAQPGVVWTKVAVLGAWLVYPGLWGAILSSAFGSVLGGPRVLQALASDGLAPSFLSRLSRRGQPTVATWISGAIALAAVALGGLNAVAQFVSILFLTLYVTINLSAAVEKLVGDPSYRPTINVPWFVSLLGSMGAMVVMFLVSPLACVAAMALELGIFLFLRRQSLRRRWGDVRAGFWVALSRFSLVQLRRHEVDPRNWRPQILLFSGDPNKRIGLVRLAGWFNQNRGLISLCQLVDGDLRRENFDIEGKRREMDIAVDREGLVAFSEVLVVPDFEEGVIDIVQAKGIAGLRANTIMFGWPEKSGRLESVLRIVRAASNAGKSTIIARLNWAHEPGQQKRIDIWWRGRQRNGDLMLLLAYLLRINPEWKNSRITLRTIVDSDAQREEVAAGLAKLVPETRIEAESDIIVKPKDRTVFEVMHDSSRDADVVFCGLMDPNPGEESEYARRLSELAGGFRTTIFVRNAGEFAGYLI
jgi:amino acid transporter